MKTEDGDVLVGVDDPSMLQKAETSERSTRDRRESFANPEDNPAIANEEAVVHSEIEQDIGPTAPRPKVEGPTETDFDLIHTNLRRQALRAQQLRARMGGDSSRPKLVEELAAETTEKKTEVFDWDSLARKMDRTLDHVQQVRDTTSPVGSNIWEKMGNDDQGITRDGVVVTKGALEGFRRHVEALDDAENVAKAIDYLEAALDEFMVAPDPLRLMGDIRNFLDRHADPITKIAFDLEANGSDFTLQRAQHLLKAVKGCGETLLFFQEKYQSEAAA